MKLCLSEMQNPVLRDQWKAKGYKVPTFDIAKMKAQTKEGCQWVHFGSGNIFRAFLAARMDDLLEAGVEKTGIVVGEGFDYEMIDKAYTKFDDLAISVTLKGNGTVEKRVLASVAEAYACRTDNEHYQRFVEIFSSKALQMVSFTITEKGYSIEPAWVKADIEKGPENCQTICCLVAALLKKRFENGAYPLAVVSMDNCSKNGEKLRNAIVSITDAWLQKGWVTKDFYDYVTDESKVSFPWSMIDKITPRPDPSIVKMLSDDGVEDADFVVTQKKTWVAPFVNSEECEYLVIEDRFPNGRPALDKVGVMFTDRETVTRVERMKVCTCLNPLHTAMSVMGCLLGYTKISDEMQDEDIVSYIKRIGYVEGMPVVTDPKILSPKSFIDDVVYKRLPNPFMPDTPQRIATDTSQKLAIRFGETAKAYFASSTLDVNELKCIPMVLASWIRYILGVDDNGQTFEISPDPQLASAQECIKSVSFGKAATEEDLKEILSREDIFGYDVSSSPLKDAVIKNFNEINAGVGAVRKALHQLVK